MKKIEAVLKEYFQAWNDGFFSKNGEEIRTFMAKNFIGYWSHSGLDKPDQYSYDYDLDAVLQQYGDAQKSFESGSITARNNGKEYLVLGREINLINGDPYPAQCMFVWRKEGEEWKLVREYIELER
ncbi:nuclear transport factor 2 family protein [Thalassobacillus devorans]|uniref:nuclear transport factor 2 family protein n=1 Tax=Thalassobacillus devorans TaxID=279813 RepID=UPI0004907D7E|nr:nuclear transport factor 2 family protein [Thalassobacillus devorans]